MKTLPRLPWRRFLLVLAAAAALRAGWPAGGAARAQNAAAGTVDFVKDVQPILAQSCYQCHDVSKKKGGLRLDSKTHALEGGDSGEKAIKPGDAGHSKLIELVKSTDPDHVMPPKGDRLTPPQIDVLTRWIGQGAHWPDGLPTAAAPKQTHWSFIRPVRPAVPQVKQPGWARNPIDHFILARLEEEGLTPSPEADRYALIRRVSLDLTGLPPMPAEVEAFVNDQGPDAYEKLVDRLLASPSYGERWARVWLDVARYADSKGHGSDPLRTIWRYRDWVIEAFNRNLPYDQFTIEQLAGDLLPNPTNEQLVATAFHRNTMTNDEGGTDDEEYRVVAVKDRTEVTLQAWMGLTMTCAQCHTHKYDPITNREYYQFFSFFNQSQDADRGDESPLLAVATPQQEAEKARLAAEAAALEQRLSVDNPEAAAARARWEQSLAEVEQKWVVLDVADFKSSGGATFVKQADKSLLASGPRAETDTYTFTAKTDLKGITALRVEALADASLPANGPGRSDNGNFVLTDFRVAVSPATPGEAVKGRFVRVELPGPAKMLSLAEVQIFSGTEDAALGGKATQSSTAFGGPPELAIDGNTNGDYNAAKSTTHTAESENPWWELDLGRPTELSRIVLWNRTDGDLHARLANFRVSVLDENRQPTWDSTVGPAPNPSVQLEVSGPQSLAVQNPTADYFQTEGGSWAPAAAIDADLSPASGWSVGPQFGKPHAAVFETARDAGLEGGTTLTFALAHTYPTASIGRFRISATTSPRPVRALPGAVAEVVAVPAEKRTDAQTLELAAYYRSISPELNTVKDRIARINQQIAAIQPPTVPIMRELPPEQRRPSHMLVKGNFLNKGDPVTPAVLEALHPLPGGAPNDRLGVALWIVDERNPLTARVAVNRFWGQLFGTGIVETQEDFGTQGTPPSHPELLDWLATEFPRSKWDVKALLKTIVTSATYRQSSRQTPESTEKDPHNRLLARGPRLRLEAELVRDQALALGGLLSKKMLGPSVFPPQPPGLWQAAFNGERTWATSTGEDKYRRGLYTFWRRTVPYPSMAAFDAPSREVCTVRRIHTSTPLQAFVTLNDPVYVEAAQALARRIMNEGGATPEQRVDYALRLCLQRPADPRQAAQLLSLYGDEMRHYQADRTGAEHLATDPLGALPPGADPVEAAAWTVVANVLLNLDAVLTKG